MVQLEEGKSYISGDGNLFFRVKKFHPQEDVHAVAIESDLFYYDDNFSDKLVNKVDFKDSSSFILPLSILAGRAGLSEFNGDVIKLAEERVKVFAENNEIPTDRAFTVSKGVTMAGKLLGHDKVRELMSKFNKGNK